MCRGVQVRGAGMRGVCVRECDVCAGVAGILYVCAWMCEVRVRRCMKCKCSRCVCGWGWGTGWRDPLAAGQAGVLHLGARLDPRAGCCQGLREDPGAPGEAAPCLDIRKAVGVRHRRDVLPDSSVEGGHLGPLGHQLSPPLGDCSPLPHQPAPPLRVCESQWEPASESEEGVPVPGPV